MMRRNLELLIGLVLIAGCVDDGGLRELPAGLERADPSEGAGIVGLVVDTQFLAVQDAGIFVDGVEAARTNETGGFRVVGLTPGDHLVAAEKVNHRGAATSVTVHEGAVTRVTLMVEILPGTAPYYSVVLQAGQIQCGASLTIPGLFTNGHFAICGIPSLAGASVGEQFRTEVEIGSLAGTNLTGVWGETAWQSTQVVGKGMKVIWWLAEPGANDLNGRYRDLRIVAGVSPLRAQLPGEALTNPEAPRQICQKTSQCLVRATHYASANTTNAAIDGGLAIQQRYTDYYSLFFNMPLPQDYSAVPDS